jgi:hypothetical protein
VASITPRTASAWVKSIRPAKKARIVNSPAAAGRAPAAIAAATIDSSIGNDPTAWISTLGDPV